MKPSHSSPTNGPLANGPLANTAIAKDFKSLSTHLGALSRATAVHAVENQAVVRILKWTAEDLNRILLANTEARVELDKGIMSVNGHPLRARREMRAQLAAFSAALRTRSSGGFRVRGAVTPATVAALFKSLSAVPEGAERDAFQRWLDANGGELLELLPPRSLTAATGGGEGQRVRMVAQEGLLAYGRCILALSRARQEGTLEKLPKDLFTALQALAELAEEDPRLHLSLSTLKEGSAFAERHPVNVAVLAMALGQRLGFSRMIQVDLGFCALLAAVLGPDAPAEARVASAERVLSTPRMTESRARQLLCVYEVGRSWKEDGRPLHLFSRVIALALAYDRTTTHLPGHPAQLPDAALAEMEASGRFDPALFGLFIKMIGRYPTGTGVLLDSGELAVVFHTPLDAAQASRPVVRLLRDASGATLSQLVDLTEKRPDGQYLRAIVRTVNLAAHGLDGQRALFH